MNSSVKVVDHQASQDMTGEYILAELVTSPGVSWLLVHTQPSVSSGISAAGLSQ